MEVVLNMRNKNHWLNKRYARVLRPLDPKSKDHPNEVQVQVYGTLNPIWVLPDEVEPRKE